MAEGLLGGREVSEGVVGVASKRATLCMLRVISRVYRRRCSVLSSPGKAQCCGMVGLRRRGAQRRQEAESEIAPAGKVSSDAETGTDMPLMRKLLEGAGAGEPSAGEALAPHEQLASV